MGQWCFCWGAMVDHWHKLTAGLTGTVVSGFLYTSKQFIPTLTDYNCCSCAHTVFLCTLQVKSLLVFNSKLKLIAGLSCLVALQPVRLSDFPIFRSQLLWWIPCSLINWKIAIIFHVPLRCRTATTKEEVEGCGQKGTLYHSWVNTGWGSRHPVAGIWFMLLLFSTAVLAKGQWGGLGSSGQSITAPLFLSVSLLWVI